MKNKATIELNEVRSGGLHEISQAAKLSGVTCWLSSTCDLHYKWEDYQKIIHKVSFNIGSDLVIHLF